MKLYFTYGEGFTASIFKTQVIDVVDHLNKTFNEDIRLFSLISLKGYFRQRKNIKKNAQFKTYVFPLIPIPKMLFWQINGISFFILCLIKKPDTLICRSIFATWIALKIKDLARVKKVVFDSRGIILEEAREYHVYPDNIFKKIEKIERDCLYQSDFVMVITQRMIEYFRERYKYSKTNYVVIPCTMGEDFEAITFDEDEIDAGRKELGYQATDIVVVFSGSNAKWQSFELMTSFAGQMMKSNLAVKFLFLTKPDESIIKLASMFEGRISCKWVSPGEVKKHLQLCDYAIMTREESRTNWVSSPTKFAEYLASGLPVIINDTMAITDIVTSNKAGVVLTESSEKTPVLNRVSVYEKKKLHLLSLKLFSKKAPGIHENYSKVLK